MAFIIEKAKWCIKNPSACASVAAQGARQKVDEVKERISRPASAPRQAPRPDADPHYRREARRAAEDVHQHGSIRNGQRVGGVKETRRESRGRVRAQGRVLEEFCTEHPDQCQARRHEAETHGFCHAFPERCQSDPKFKGLYERHQELGGMGLRRENDVREANLKERRKRAEMKVKESENRQNDFWLSAPGRFVDAVGAGYVAVQKGSRQAVKGAGRVLGVAPPYRYAAKPRKARGKGSRTKASKALKNADKITSKIIG
jgi:hypothetical protein